MRRERRMAKVKSKILTEVNGVFGIKIQSQVDMGTMSATLSKTQAGTVWKARSVPTDAQAVAQLWQRDLYRDADCLWKNMTPGHRLLWSQFARDYPEQQNQAPSAEGKPTLWVQQHEVKPLSERQNFMRKALKFNLEPFFSEYCQTVMQLYDVEWQDNRVTAVMKLVKLSEAGMPSAYLDEPDVFRMRRW